MFKGTARFTRPCLLTRLAVMILLIFHIFYKIYYLMLYYSLCYCMNLICLLFFFSSIFIYCSSVLLAFIIPCFDAFAVSFIFFYFYLFIVFVVVLLLIILFQIFELFGCLLYFFYFYFLFCSVYSSILFFISILIQASTFQISQERSKQVQGTYFENSFRKRK